MYPKVRERSFIFVFTLALFWEIGRHEISENNLGAVGLLGRFWSFAWLKKQTIGYWCAQILLFSSKGAWFNPKFIYTSLLSCFQFSRPTRLVVRTLASHAGNRSSNLLWVTITHFYIHLYQCITIYRLPIARRFRAIFNLY